jgi:hypothetical protein
MQKDNGLKESTDTAVVLRLVFGKTGINPGRAIICPLLISWAFSVTPVYGKIDHHSLSSNLLSLHHS